MVGPTGLAGRPVSSPSAALLGRQALHFSFGVHTQLVEQAISLTRTFPAPGDVGSSTVFRGTGNLTVANLLLARQVLSQALSQVRHELGVEGHTDEVD